VLVVFRKYLVSLLLQASPPPERTMSKLKNGERSRPGTPDSMESGAANQETEIAGDDQKKIRSLASAILQIEQAVEAKYLQKPLGENDKEKQKRLKKLQAKKEEGKFVEISYQVKINLQ
jgi:hypothetical protein